MIYPPDPAPPVPEGAERHQYLFMVDNLTWDSWTDEEKLSNLLDYFGDCCFFLKQKVVESKEWHV
jgi:hypothetical protein